MQHKNSKKSSSDSYYMYGKHAVFAAMQNPNRYVEKLLCTQEILSGNHKFLNQHKPEVATSEQLTKLAGANNPHQGIVAKVKTIFSNDIHDIDFSKANCRIAILDQVTDTQNIGAIIRSAAAFGIEAIILPQDNSPNENATIAKAASGNLEMVKIIKVINLKSTMELLKKKGFWIIGFDGESKEILNKNLLANKVAIVLGSEEKGMRRLTAETCDHLVKIPMVSTVESLNVSNAAAIAFYLTYANTLV